MAKRQPCGDGRTSKVGRLQHIPLEKPNSPAPQPQQPDLPGWRSAAWQLLPPHSSLPGSSMHPTWWCCTSAACLVVPSDLKCGPKILSLPLRLANASASVVIQHGILKYKWDHWNYWKLPTPIWNLTQDRKPLIIVSEPMKSSNTHMFLYTARRRKGDMQYLLPSS